MTFTSNDLDTRLCDYNNHFKSTRTVRQQIHSIFTYIFGRDSFNDIKLNSLSNDDLTKLIYELIYLKKKITHREGVGLRNG